MRERGQISLKGKIYLLCLFEAINPSTTVTLTAPTATSQDSGNCFLLQCSGAEAERREEEQIWPLLLQSCQSVFTRCCCTQQPISTCRAWTGFASSTSQGSQTYPASSQESISKAGSPNTDSGSYFQTLHHFSLAG